MIQACFVLLICNYFFVQWSQHHFLHECCLLPLLTSSPPLVTLTFWLKFSLTIITLFYMSLRLLHKEDHSLNLFLLLFSLHCLKPLFLLWLWMFLHCLLALLRTISYLTAYHITSWSVGVFLFLLGCFAVLFFFYLFTAIHSLLNCCCHRFTLHIARESVVSIINILRNPGLSIF